MSLDNETFEELNQIIDSPQAVLKLRERPQERPLVEKIKSLVASANESTTREREVPVVVALDVAKIALSKHIKLPHRSQIEFKAFRELSNFLEMATSGKPKTLAMEYTNFLPLGHPLSTSPNLEAVSEEEIREARAEWLAADPRISAELRPVVASAFLTAPDSLERKYAIARLSSIDSNEMPRDVSLALINSK
jgi:hypothetical protein